jgi:hypothetical protein
MKDLARGTRLGIVAKSHLLGRSAQRLRATGKDRRTIPAFLEGKFESSVRGSGTIFSSRTEISDANLTPPWGHQIFGS